MLKAVSNSGPIIHLHEINQLKLFDLFGDLIIPVSVSNEIKGIDISRVKTVDVKPDEIKGFVEQIKEFNLHTAEIDAMCLADKTNVVFLTDDLHARKAAIKLNIKVHGSLGIISLAYKKGILILDEAKQQINNLYNNSTLFLTKALVEIAMQKLES